MPAIAEQTVHSLEVLRDELIAATPEIVFESILEQMGPGCEEPDSTHLPMVLEPWPGGRWFRDLGNNAGHLWAHVQAIKPPALLELYGPMFLSFPVTSNIQYRLSAQEDGRTRLLFTHRMLGMIPPELQDGVAVNHGWTNMIDGIRKRAESRTNR